MIRPMTLIRLSTLGGGQTFLVLWLSRNLAISFCLMIFQISLSAQPNPDLALQDSDSSNLVGHASAGVRVSQEPAQDQINLSDCLEKAERNNPGLKAAYYKWQGALQRIPQAQSLPDPQLTFMEYLNRSMEIQEELGIMQMYPYPGKRELQGRVESDEAQALHKETEKVRLELRMEVKDAYYEYYYIEQTVRINHENVSLLQHFEDVARTQYGVGKAGSQDVIKAQVELGKLENELLSLEDSRTPVRSRLNATMNQPTDSPLPPPQEIQTNQLSLATDAVLEMAFRYNPELQALDARLRKSRNQVALAQRDYYPDFTLGINWMKGNDSMEEPPSDDYVATVQINLPIYRGRLAAAVREAESSVREVQSMKEDTRNKLAVDLQGQLYKLRNAERRLRLLSDMLIPKARQSLQIYENSYSSGLSNFLDLVDTQRNLLAFEEDYYRSIADYAQALAKIEVLVGKALTDESSPTILRPAMTNQLAPQDGPIEVDVFRTESRSPSDSATPDQRNWPIEPSLEPSKGTRGD